MSHSTTLTLKTDMSLATQLYEDQSQVDLEGSTQAPETGKTSWPS